MNARNRGLEAVADIVIAYPTSLPQDRTAVRLASSIGALRRPVQRAPRRGGGRNEEDCCDCPAADPLHPPSARYSMCAAAPEPAPATAPHQPVQGIKKRTGSVNLSTCADAGASAR